MTRLEVWGDPIDHSLSPRIHAAAYAALGWDWTYDRRRVAEARFRDELTEHGPALLGISLTYPLKTVAFDSAARRDRFAELTGAVNTYLLTPGGPLGFNTDVGGIAADLRAHGVRELDTARIVGAGATATSALVALAELGATHVALFARRVAAARPLVELGERIGVQVDARALDAEASAEQASRASTVLTVSALPGGAEVPTDTAAALAGAGGMLYDVVYGHWPTPLAAAWQRAGLDAVDGRGMLVQQAVRQIRIFRGDADEPLPREDVIVDVMRRALMGD